MIKHLPAMQEIRVRSLGQEDPPGEGNGNPLQFLPGKSHGRRSLVGHSPWGRKSLTRLHFPFLSFFLVAVVMVIKVFNRECCSVLSDSLQPHGLCNPIRLLCYGNLQSKNAGMGCHALLQGIFPTQGSNPGLPQCRWIIYHLRHQGSPSS